MRLSRIWRILQIKEGVIHRGRRPRWITPSEICRILHILRKPNSIIALLFIQNISPRVLKGVSPFRSLFFRSTNITQSCPRVFSVNGSIICSGLHFWRHFDVISSIIFGGLHFWRHWFNMVNYACGFNQSEAGKYIWMNNNRVYQSISHIKSIFSAYFSGKQVFSLSSYGLRCLSVRYQNGKICSDFVAILNTTPSLLIKNKTQTAVINVYWTCTFWLTLDVSYVLYIHFEK